MATQPQPRTRPLDDSKPLDNLFPSRFLKPCNLLTWNVSRIAVTIDHLQEEEVQPKPGQVEWKPVLYFRNKNGAVHPQGYLLSAKADKDALKTATGAQTIGALAGKRITIKLDEFRGRAVLRIDPAPPPAE
jgi:hypothetical protein